MSTQTLKNALNLTDNQFEALKQEFTKSEKIDIIKNVLLGVINGKTILQTINEISFKNKYLTDRNYKKFSEVLSGEKHLISIAFKEILSEKYNQKISGDGAV